MILNSVGARLVSPSRQSIRQRTLRRKAPTAFVYLNNAELFLCFYRAIGFCCLLRNCINAAARYNGIMSKTGENCECRVHKHC